VKPIWIPLEQVTVSGSGISWAMCKSAPRWRQITTPAPNYLVFLQAGRPTRRPTNSVNALKAKTTRWYKVRTNLYPHYENAPTRLVLSYTNNAVNFFMYFVSGSKFRVAFADTFSRARAAVTENMILSFG